MINETFYKCGTKEEVINLIRNIYKKPIICFMLQDGRLDVSPLSWGIRKECHHSPLLFPQNALGKGNKIYVDMKEK
jgi:hypothetical protein